MEAKIYPECIKNYPFVLGAQPLRMIDLAGFYASIVNEGLRVTPYAIDSIEQNGHAVYKHQAGPPHMLAMATAPRSISSAPSSKASSRAAPRPRCSDLAHFVGGKTGTTENENDAWFVGFTSDVTVAVWVGYDNARGKQTLGHSGTGGVTAVPIARPIIEASWNIVGPKTPLPPPSAEAARHLKAAADRLRQRPAGRRPTAARSPSISSSTATNGARHAHTRWPAATSRLAASCALRPMRARTARPSAMAAASGRNTWRRQRLAACRRRTGCRATCGSCSVFEMRSGHTNRPLCSGNFV